MAKKTVKKGRKKHFNVQAGKLYEVKDGKAVKKNRNCPRCKKTMAKAQGREFCGSCGYTITAKKDENRKEEKKEDKK